MTRNIASRLTSSLIKTVMTLLSVLALVIIFNESPVSAEQLDIMIDATGNASKLTDGSYSTTVGYSLGDSIIISSDTPIDSLYIIWDSPVSQWTLDTGSQKLICGTNGFLHEYIKLPGSTENLSINIHDTCRISDIYAFSEGDVPDYVQIWEKPCETADFLVFSTHADDEILFLGGVLATYGGEASLPVQVCYLTNYWNGLHIREHEKLDGLWECGIRNYPVNGDFDDLYSETLQQAESVYVYDDILDYVTSQIRRFKPNIAVTQDLDGEYGHGGHMILAKAVTEAVENSMSATFFPDSASEYGVWDVKKTYLHLYPENEITLDLRQPLSKLNDRSALQTAKDAYLKHVSQQWCWFYVSDTNEYSCSRFGLYRSTVGADTGSDMTENITTYKETAELLEKEKTLKLEAEKKAKEEAELKEKEFAENESIALANSLNSSNSPGRNNAESILAVIILVFLMVILQLITILIVFNITKSRSKKRKKS